MYLKKGCVFVFVFVFVLERGCKEDAGGRGGGGADREPGLITKGKFSSPQYFNSHFNCC